MNFDNFIASEIARARSSGVGPAMPKSDNSGEMSHTQSRIWQVLKSGGSMTIAEISEELNGMDHQVIRQSLNRLCVFGKVRHIGDDHSHKRKRKIWEIAE